MDKLSQAVLEIDKLYAINKALLEKRYEKIEYTHEESYIHLKCFLPNGGWKQLSVGKDCLGPRPQFYTGLERQKRGGYKKELEDLESYRAKEQRIQETDGLIIKFKFHENSQTFEIAPTYHYSNTDFPARFKSHFLQ